MASGTRRASLNVDQLTQTERGARRGSLNLVDLARSQTDPASKSCGKPEWSSRSSSRSKTGSVQPRKNSWYEDLPSLSTFEEALLMKRFCQAPPDWWIVITDVCGSTKAIDEEELYREVNVVGAAAISVAQQRMPGQDFPAVFGGDGSTMIIPPEHIDDVLAGLSSLQKLSRQTFGLDLRVGSVKIAELQDAGFCVSVAKHELHAGKCSAMIQGGGLTEAEARIKGRSKLVSGNKQYLTVCDAEVNSAGLESVCEGSEMDLKLCLEGMSCRWKPIKSRMGAIASILVVAREGKEDDAYAWILEELRVMLGGTFEKANPIKIENMEYKSVKQCIAEEKKYHASIKGEGRSSWMKRKAEIVAAVLIFKWGMPSKCLGLDAKYYSKQMALHSDFRKFDDALRMVLDVTHEQTTRLRQCLTRGREMGLFDFGVHMSDSALMTCLLQSTQDGQHVHFIDGNDGGYTRASKELKRQLKETSTSSDGTGPVQV